MDEETVAPTRSFKNRNTTEGVMEVMHVDNAVTVSGLLHHIRTGKKNEKYFPFSIKQETLWNDGTTRRDFLLSRAFHSELQEEVRGLPEGTPLRVSGVLQTSLGSGEMYIHVKEVQKVQPVTAD